MKAVFFDIDGTIISDDGKKYIGSIDGFSHVMCSYAPVSTI